MIQVQDGAEYLFHRTNYGQVLGKMLNNKVDTAYQMLISEEDFVIPGYVEEVLYLNLAQQLFHTLRNTNQS